MSDHRYNSSIITEDQRSEVEQDASSMQLTKNGQIQNTN